MVTVRFAEHARVRRFAVDFRRSHDREGDGLHVVLLVPLDKSVFAVQHCGKRILAGRQVLKEVGGAIGEIVP